MDVKKWWGNLSTIGPAFGYYVNPKKTWLFTKDNHVPSASEMFSGWQT